MSGGAFDYAYCKVVVFADDLEQRLDRHDENDDFGNTPNEFSQHVLKKLKEIEVECRKAAALMREAEWLYSGDTSESVFMRRVEAIEDGDDSVSA